MFCVVMFVYSVVTVNTQVCKRGYQRKNAAESLIAAEGSQPFDVRDRSEHKLIAHNCLA